jgi:hypothetical protein
MLHLCLKDNECRATDREMDVEGRAQLMLDVTLLLFPNPSVPLPHMTLSHCQYLLSFVTLSLFSLPSLYSFLICISAFVARRNGKLYDSQSLIRIRYDMPQNRENIMHIYIYTPCPANPFTTLIYLLSKGKRV